MKKYLTANEVAKILRLELKTINNRLYEGYPMPPYIKIGKTRLFPEEDLKKWMEDGLIYNKPSTEETGGQR